MAEQIRMDSHKLMLHPEVVSRWRRGEVIYPIEMEIGLSGACNHRCVFCAVDYVGYQTKFLDTDILVCNLEGLGKKGLKSIIYSGEGEPLLHKNAGVIFNKTKGFGIDAALATNGVLMSKDFSEEALASLSWVRVSIAAATDQTYEKIHHAKKGDLQKVLKNLQDAVELKKKRNLKTTLGAQLLLLPENKDEVLLLAKILREIGLDYFTVKPFSQHPQSKAKLQVDYADCNFIEALKDYETERFKVFFRENSIENLAHEKTYCQCFGLNFMTHIDAGGNVFPCIAFVGKQEMCYGNIYIATFDELWNSERTRKIISGFSGEFLQENCRKACRLDEMNKYLYELKHPGLHVNFI